MSMYNDDDVDAALCVWENVLETIDNYAGDDRWEGYAWARTEAATLGRRINRRWMQLEDADRHLVGSFDWGFVPAVVSYLGWPFECTEAEVAEAFDEAIEGFREGDPFRSGVLGNIPNLVIIDEHVDAPDPAPNDDVLDAMSYTAFRSEVIGNIPNLAIIDEHAESRSGVALVNIIREYYENIQNESSRDLSV